MRPALLLPSFLLFTLGIAACGQDDADPGTQPTPGQPATGAVTGSQVAATLDACSLPKPCAWPTNTGSGEDKASIRCVVNELASGHSLSVETKLVADGPATGCEVKQGLHFFAGSNVAYLLWRKTCGATEEHKLEKCTMLDAKAYSTCLSSFDASTTAASSDGFECSLPTDWMSGCVPVEQASCAK